MAMSCQPAEVEPEVCMIISHMGKHLPHTSAHWKLLACLLHLTVMRLLPNLVDCLGTICAHRWCCSIPSGLGLSQGYSTALDYIFDASEQSKVADNSNDRSGPHSAHLKI